MLALLLSSKDFLRSISRCLTRHCLPALNHVASLLPITADRIKKLVVLVKKEKNLKVAPLNPDEIYLLCGILVIDDKLEYFLFQHHYYAV